jgi:hypothetical protein
MLFATEDFHLNLTARVTSDPEARLRTGIFVPEGTSINDSGADSAGSGTEGEPVPGLDDVMSKSFAVGILDKVRAERQALEQHRETRPAAPGMGGSCAVQVDTGAHRAEQRDSVLVAFGVTNGCSDPFAMTGVQLFDSVGPVSHAQALRIWRARGGEIAAHGGVLAEIEPGEELVGALDGERQRPGARGTGSQGARDPGLATPWCRR